MIFANKTYLEIETKQNAIMSISDEIRETIRFRNKMAYKGCAI
jgi:hypothetical protein